MLHHQNYGVLMCLLLAVSCGSPAIHSDMPENLIPRDTFLMVLSEVQIIEGVIKQNILRNDDPTKLVEEHYNELFDRYHINQTRFTETYRWWYEHPEELDGLLQEVVESLSDMERDWVQKEQDKTTP